MTRTTGSRPRRRRLGDDPLFEHAPCDLVREEYWAERVAPIVPTFEATAAELGLPSAEVYVQRVRDHLTSLFRRAEVAIRVRPRGLIAFLVLGRLMTAAEMFEWDGRTRWPEESNPFPGMSADHVPNWVRQQAELQMFDDHPIHGYLTERGRLEADYDGLTDAYGPVALILRRQVWRRSTFTLGDMLIGWADEGSGPPCPLLEPLPHAFAFGAPGQPWADPLQRDTIAAVPLDAGGDVAAPLLEVQILGGVTLADVKAVSLHRKPEPEVAVLMRERGIRWTVRSRAVA